MVQFELYFVYSMAIGNLDEQTALETEEWAGFVAFLELHASKELVRGLWIELEVSFDVVAGESAFSAALEGCRIAIFEGGYVHDLNFVMMMIVVVVLDISLEKEVDQLV